MGNYHLGGVEGAALLDYFGICKDIGEAGQALFYGGVLCFNPSQLVPQTKSLGFVLKFFCPGL